LAYLLPANFAQNVQGVTWTANYTASVSSLQMQWQWGAANYLSNDNKGHVFPMSGGAPDYNAMMVDPVHNVATCMATTSNLRRHAGERHG
jgi:glucose dehydrogenase